MAGCFPQMYREIAERLLQLSEPSRRDLERLKMEVCKLKSLERLPSNSQILKGLKGSEAERLRPILMRKTVRSISGVTVIAAMTAPYPCPHGRCLYCPGGPTRGVPQSYTGHEPAAMRGIQNQYDPYRQVASRIRQLQEIGHRVDKVELIVMGGNFTSMPVEYQEGFIKGCLDALAGAKSESLEEAKRRAETAQIRNVGLTLEVRPDWASKPQVDRMLSLGATRVELGVQNIYDDIYRLVGRGHTVDDVIEATRLLKDSGLKVCYHLMPGLPGSNPERDLEGFHRIFTDPAFQPDMVKFYPCLVMEGTELHAQWLAGDYKPLSTNDAAELLAEVKEFVPPWVRVMRVQRDIPSPLIAGGVDKSNLREIAQERMKLKGVRCRCIRCREVGHKMLKEQASINFDSVKLLNRSYKASGGVEHFLSIEDEANDMLLGYLRLRIPSSHTFRREMAGRRCAFIRELHVLGPMVPVHRRLEEALQHRGYGATLMTEAEKLATAEYGVEKILVNSALGTKRYYLNLGYSYEGPYMVKELEA